MKNKVLNYLIIAAIAVSAAFTSCKKDDDKNNNDNDVVKLLETIVWKAGYWDKYEYDGKNRISKRSVYGDGKLYTTGTFTYSGDDLVKIAWAYPDHPNYDDEEVFEKTGNTIKIDDGGNETLTLNNDGYLTKYVYEDEGDDWSEEIEITFEYKDGNLTKSKWIYIEDGVKEEEVEEYKYDDKKSPFLHCKTPKWYLIFGFVGDDGFLGLKNNLTEIRYE
jgi:hypothetical protein